MQKYSDCHWKINKCCFMKQKYHFQRGELQYENATMPLSSLGIHTGTHSYHTLALSKEVYNFVFAQGAQKLSAIKI